MNTDAHIQQTENGADGRSLAIDRELTLIPVTIRFKETPDRAETMTFCEQDTEGLDIDDEVFFSGLTHEEISALVGSQIGEDFIVESVGEPYHIKTSSRTHDPGADAYGAPPTRVDALNREKVVASAAQPRTRNAPDRGADR